MTGSTPWPRPDALLLDFGGVIMLTSKPAGGREAAAAVRDRLARAGHHLPLDDVAQSLHAGRTALKLWKHSSSRRRAPRELSHAEIVGDFLAADLPDGARDLLLSDSTWLLDLLTTTISAHTVRPGIRELLTAAGEQQIPVGIVSNAHSGASHRRILAEHGLADQFAVQVYSDEVGIRKPNPAILTLATDALGVRPQDCWYVGDTLDRDVVAARRAGIGTVLLTRSQHTDTPPFPVRERPDAVYPDPRGLLEAFHAATRSQNATTSAPATTPAPAAHHPAHIQHPAQLQQPIPPLHPTAPAGEPHPTRAALLIDHGGVISTSHPDPAELHQFATEVAALLATPEEPLDAHTVLALITDARAQTKTLKAELHREISPPHFWVDLVGEHLSARQRALLRTEAYELSYRLGMAKSRRTLRQGVPELLATCRDLGMPVAVVSNTVSGRAVRTICTDHGLDPLISAYFCSDEFGARKPAASIVRAALRAVAAEPRHSWFLGDKPTNDAAAATAAGIGHRVLVRGGSTPDPEIQAALTSGQASAVVDHPGELNHLLSTAHSPAR